MIPSPWPARRLRALGDCIRDDVPVPGGTPSYSEAMVWFGDVLAAVQDQISTLDWEALLESRRPEITSRVKTVDTLRDKLRSHHGSTLPTVQDVAGLRFEAEMTLAEQDAVVTAICGLFGHDVSAVKDLRNADHSGYRAVHIWLRLEARVEVQVRTHLQGAWANAYEAAGDLMGRGIRYGELPANESYRQLVIMMQQVSREGIAETERVAVDVQRLALSIADADRGVAAPDGMTSVQLSSSRDRLGQMHKRQLEREGVIRAGLQAVRDALLDLQRTDEKETP